MNKKQHNIGDNIMINEGEKWSFDNNIPPKFENHISKSVPFYNEGHELILELSRHFINEEAAIYELGCSTGLLSYKLSQIHQKSNIIAYDISEKMIKYAKHTYSNTNLFFHHDDVTKITLDKTHLVIAYYTLQFIEENKRLTLLKHIYEALEPGSAFVFFEKTYSTNSQINDLVSDLYIKFKRNNGYSLEEINNKAKSLQGVLNPHSEQGNLKLLEKSGFKTITSIFQYLCFQGYLAIK